MSARELFEATLTDSLSRNMPSVVLGELLAINPNAESPYLVQAAQLGDEAIFARSMIDLFALHIGKKVVLNFENGDPRLPIIMGVLHEPQNQPLATQDNAHGTVQIEADGSRMLVSAKEQIVLRCGKASITLTKAGKVLIQGAYLSSRSTGVNRIKGGSVQIN
jgi:uncharacterized protein (DUF2345 family)